MRKPARQMTGETGPTPPRAAALPKRVGEEVKTARRVLLSETLPLSPWGRVARNETGGVPIRGGILLFLLCTGCAPHRVAPPAEVRDPNLKVALGMTPRPVTSLDPTALTVRVTDSAGKPVGGASVALRLDMPAMPMGDNVVAMRETAAGSYVGTGRFTMAGTWRVTASVAKGPERATRVFSVDVR